MQGITEMTEIQPEGQQTQAEEQQTQEKKGSGPGGIFFLLLLYGILFWAVTEIFSGRIQDQGWMLMTAAAVASIPPGICLIRFPCCRELLTRRRTISPGTWLFLFMTVLTLNFAATLLTGPAEALLGLFGLSARTGSGAKEATSAGLLMYVCLAAPVLEELIFRGALLGSLKKYGGVFAVAVSAFFFGIMHHDLYQGFAAFLGGFVYGYAAYRYSFGAAAALHIANNTFSELASSLGGTNPGLPVLLILLVSAAVSITGGVRYLIRTGKRRKKEREAGNIAGKAGKTGKTAPAAEVWKNSGFWLLAAFDLTCTVLWSVHGI